jgi:hypothetical protein
MNTPPIASPRETGCIGSRAERHEFYHRYDLLLANWYLLTSVVQQDIEVIRRDLHDELARWRPPEAEPDWNAYADRMSGLAGATIVKPAAQDAIIDEEYKHVGRTSHTIERAT